jgi:hypothetical protein
MPRQTPHSLKELRARAIAVLGIDIDTLPPLLRLSDIVRSPKSARSPPGLLPISARTFYQWVAQGLIPPATKFQDGISSWSRDVIVRIALDGIPRAPGHGRKLVRRQPENPRVRRKPEGEPALNVVQP